MELKVDRGIVDSCSVLNRFIVIVKLAYGHFVCKKALKLSSFHSQEPKRQASALSSTDSVSCSSSAFFRVIITVLRGRFPVVFVNTAGKGGRELVAKNRWMKDEIICPTLRIAELLQEHPIGGKQRRRLLIG